MKKTRWKNILRSIKQSINRFLSIMFIVALGAGFMAGLAAASPDMYASADRYIDEYRLFDIDIKFPAGITDEDIAAVKETEKIDEIEHARVFDMVLSQEGGSDFTSRVYGVLDKNGNTDLNCLNLTEGRLPEKENECVVESVFGKYSGETISIGDKLVPEPGTQDYDMLKEYMPEPVMEVVGICQSPMSISIEGDSTNIGAGTINLNVYVKEDFFSCGFYTDLFIRIEDSDKFDTFSEKYSEYADAVINDIRTVGDQRAEIRVSDLKDELDEQMDSIRQLSETAEGIERTQENLNKAYEQGMLIMQEAAEHDPSVMQLIKKLGVSDKDDYTFSPASDLSAQLEKLLTQAEKQYDQIDGISWIYRTRNDLAGFESYSSNVGKVSALAKIFPVFFFIVALLVALTTMSRLIEEKRLQIGTMKAIGFSDKNILFEFILFSLLASTAGCIIGMGIGFRIFPAAINSAYSMMYVLPQMETPVHWDIVIWVAPVTIGSILVAALWSCWNEFRSMPAVLMVPRSPAAGKRIWLEHVKFIWKKLPFTYKVTFRNLFRYKKRFIMTIIGVAGCSALLLTGFGIKDSVNDIVDKQFGEIYKYDSVFALDEQASLVNDEKIMQILNDEDKVAAYTLSGQETGRIFSGKQSQELTLFIPQKTDIMKDFITLRDRKSGEEYVLDNDTCILSEKMCEEMSIKPGDEVYLENSSGKRAGIRVKAVTENYVSSFAYMTEEAYMRLFGSTPSYTALLCITRQSITMDMLESSHIIYGRDVAGMKSSFDDSIQSINGVIYVLIIAAGLLCIVVLYNLINVNICERRKELATLRVLGFFNNETQNYIFRETNILSFLGSLVGLVIGIWLHGFVVKTVEVNHIMFGRDIKPLSFIIAMAISMCFTLIVDLIMKRSINSTDMVEAMKANE